VKGKSVNFNMQDDKKIKKNENIVFNYEVTHIEKKKKLFSFKRKVKRKDYIFFEKDIKRGNT